VVTFRFGYIGGGYVELGRLCFKSCGDGDGLTGEIKVPRWTRGTDAKCLDVGHRGTEL